MADFDERNIGELERRGFVPHVPRTTLPPGYAPAVIQPRDAPLVPATHIDSSKSPLVPYVQTPQGWRPMAGSVFPAHTGEPAYPSWYKGFVDESFLRIETVRDNRDTRCRVILGPTDVGTTVDIPDLGKFFAINPHHERKTVISNRSAIGLGSTRPTPIGTTSSAKLGRVIT